MINKLNQAQVDDKLNQVHADDTQTESSPAKFNYVYLTTMLQATPTSFLYKFCTHVMEEFSGTHSLTLSGLDPMHAVSQINTEITFKTSGSTFVES